jgi:hypothetical protein
MPKSSTKKWSNTGLLPGKNILEASKHNIQLIIKEVNDHVNAVVESKIYDEEKLGEISQQILANQIVFQEIKNDFNMFLNGKHFNEFRQTEWGKTNAQHVTEYLKNASEEIGKIYGILHADSQQSR